MAVRTKRRTTVTEDRGQYGPPPPVYRQSLVPWLLALLFLAAAIAGFAWAISERDSGPPTGRVPNLVGAEHTQAGEQLKAAGFRVRHVPQASEASEGRVLDQHPEPDAVLSRGSEVALIYSAGVPQVEVPRLIGVRTTGAARLLKTAGLAGEPQIVPSDEPQGTVIAQDPPPGFRVAKQSTIAYKVSQGPLLVEVPALRGLLGDRAVAKVKGAGLVPVTQQIFSPERPGTVVAQKPAPGTEVKPKSEVFMNISKGSGLVTVPALEGLVEPRASNAVKEAGLVPVVVPTASPEAKGTVLSQAPPRNSKVKPGSKVRMSVSTGPAKPKK